MRADMTVLANPVETARRGHVDHGRDFEVSEGETIPFVLTYGLSHLPLPGRDHPADALQDTEDYLDRLVQPLRRTRAINREPGAALADHC